MSDNFSRSTGGFDAETNELFNAHFECFDCGLFYSWPITPGLAPNEDPKQSEMLALVNAHTSAACRASQQSAAVELEKAQAAEVALEAAELMKDILTLEEIGEELQVRDAERSYEAGVPMAVSGDPVVTLRQAIARGAVTITKGLPAPVAWRRSNPSLDGTYRVRWLTGPTEPLPTSTFLWPAPSHHSLTDSITALAEQQRRLMIGGRLTPSG